MGYGLWNGTRDAILVDELDMEAAENWMREEDGFEDQGCLDDLIDNQIDESTTEINAAYFSFLTVDFGGNTPLAAPVKSPPSRLFLLLWIVRVQRLYYAIGISSSPSDLRCRLSLPAIRENTSRHKDRGMRR